MPDATRETRMLSMLVWVSAVLLNAPAKFPPFILSKALAGKLVRLVQSRHANEKIVPEDVSIRGKLVRLEQPCHANAKSVPDEVSISGKLVSSDQSLQKLLKSVTEP